MVPRTLFSPIIFNFGELDSIVIARIVGVYITLSYNVQRIIKLAINTLVCIYTSMTFPTFFKIQPSQDSQCIGGWGVRLLQKWEVMKYILGVGSRGCFPFIPTDCFDFYFAEVSLRILILLLFLPCMGSHSCRWAVSFCCLLINVLSRFAKMFGQTNITTLTQKCLENI